LYESLRGNEVSDMHKNTSNLITGHPDDGLLMAYRDGEMGIDGYQATADHIHACDACQARLSRIESVAHKLQALAPNALETADPRRSLASLKQTIRERKERSMLDKIRGSKSLQRTLAGAFIALMLIALFALPPVRALASDFLGLFRVQKFVVVDMNPERLAEIERALSEVQFGELRNVSEGEDATLVGSLAEAEALAGFDVRTADTDYGAADQIGVTSPKSAEFIPDVEALRQIFTTLGVDPTVLPDNIDGQTFTFSAESGVLQIWEDANGQHEFSLMQIPSPTVDGPEDVDIKQLGKAMLMVLGMNEDTAERMSQEIDWTSTLVLPVPQDLASVQEVRIDGTTGLLFDTEGEAGGGALLWQKNGIVYVLMADSMNNFQMEQIANSLN
jgi:anti-sigma factor RsiW